jgi:predicted amidohydrolase YtcJ
MKKFSIFDFSRIALILVFAVLVIFPSCAQKAYPPADLVLLNGDIYTVDPDMPEASAVVITENKITDVCTNDSKAKKYIGEGTRVIDLGGRFVTPGMIDGHVHYGRAGALINDANLMTVSDDEGLRREIQRVEGILDDGEWITEGLWGA